MRFDEDFIQRVIEANNIVELISQYTELKGLGHRYMGLCPFPDHHEKTPSFSVSESKQLYHCFGCKKSGNIITFLKSYNGYSFLESIEFLASRAHIELPEDKGGRPSSGRLTAETKRQMYRANKMAAWFYHQQLKELGPDHKLKAYLEKRGLTGELVESFRLGYAPEAWDGLTHFLASKGVPQEISEKLGLTRSKVSGGSYDLFRDRLMFPIWSVAKEVVGFGGRIIDQGQPKYKNSPESPIFKKSQSFYGLEKAGPSIRKEGRVFVVEGYMDLLALYSHGIENVVAVLGTALTEEHGKILKRWSQNVVLLFDGDQAGQMASERSLPHFLRQDLLPQVLILPPGQDPDDYISEKGSQGFLEKAKESTDLFSHLMGTWLGDYEGNPKDKLRIVDQVAPLIRQLKDRRLQQMYGEELARRLGEEAPKVFQWIRQSKTSKKPLKPFSSPGPQAPEPSEQEFSLEGVNEDELGLLGFSLKSLKCMDFFVKQEGLEILSQGVLKELFTQVVSRYGQEPEAFDGLKHLVVSKLKAPEKMMNLINILPAEEGSEEDEKGLKECFIRVKDRHLERKASILVTQMKNNPSGGELERFMNIQNQRKLLKELKRTPLGQWPLPGGQAVVPLSLGVDSRA